MRTRELDAQFQLLQSFGYKLGGKVLLAANFSFNELSAPGTPLKVRSRLSGLIEISILAQLNIQSGLRPSFRGEDTAVLLRRLSIDPVLLALRVEQSVRHGPAWRSSEYCSQFAQFWPWLESLEAILNSVHFPSSIQCFGP